MLDNRLMPRFAFTVLKEFQHHHQKTSPIPSDKLTELHSLFGAPFAQATELLDHCKIIQYQTSDQTRKVFKIGRGTHWYTIYPEVNFCPCPAFVTQVLESGAALTCKHVLALKLNEIFRVRKVQVATVTDSQFVDFLNEQLRSCNDSVLQ